MKLVKPTYVSLFKCKADKCRDTCCAGWEIDIDERTLMKYQALTGDMGNEIRRSICRQTSAVSHFSLSDGERCPFLDGEGLCRIISTLGDGWLCDICREHPRYYNRLGDTLECGIGLACEAAAELILSCELPLSFESEEWDGNGRDDEPQDPATVDFIRSVRQKIFDLCASEESAFDALSRVCCYAMDADDRLFDIQASLQEDTSAPPIHQSGDSLYDLFMSSFEELLSLEALDDSFRISIHAARAFLDKESNLERLLPSVEPFAKRLLTYFIHRYLSDAVYDGRLGGRIRLSVLSSLTMCLVALSRGATELPDISSVAKDLSKSLEYSTENTKKLIYFLS